jgi:hypothetical protein
MLSFLFFLLFLRLYYFEIKLFKNEKVNDSDGSLLPRVRILQQESERGPRPNPRATGNG